MNIISLKNFTLLFGVIISVKETETDLTVCTTFCIEQ